MKRQLAFTALVLILLLPAQTIASQDHIEYNVSLNTDGSATWKIIQVTDINSTVDSLEQFQQRLINTINNAKDTSSREMALDFSSLEMKIDIHWETSSQTIQYIFRWENFSTIKDDKITFGDVFSSKFFSSFYGDGELFLIYPPQYTVSEVSPSPDEQNNSTQTLHWYRTQEFPALQLNITLTKNYADTNLPQTTLAIAVSGVSATVAVLGVVLFNYRRQRKRSQLQMIKPVPVKENQNSGEKIIQLVKSSGGSIKQSEICTQLKFSRAKTSLLLAEMEKKNQVRRDKKGKNKIVYITK
jgi:uncharacterized membrane protein